MVICSYRNSERLMKSFYQLTLKKQRMNQWGLPLLSLFGVVWFLIQHQLPMAILWMMVVCYLVGAQVYYGPSMVLKRTQKKYLKQFGRIDVPVKVSVNE